MSVTIQKSTSGAIFYIQNPGESESTPYNVNDFDLIPTGDGVSLSLVRKFRRTVVNDQINPSDIILKQPYTNVINGDTGIAFASYGAYRTYIETNFFRNPNAVPGGGTTTNPITFNNSGSGDASGVTFDGSAERTISYNSIGAQSLLVSGTNIKTINSTSLLGSGDIVISASGTHIPTANTNSQWDGNTNFSANSFIPGYQTIATAAGTTTLTVASPYQTYFTGTTIQTVLLPVTSTLVLGERFQIVNNSTGIVTIQSSGANVVTALSAGQGVVLTCILTSGTSAASWAIDNSVTFASGIFSGLGTGASPYALVIDSAPTNGSSNPVTSGGVYTALSSISPAGSNKQIQFNNSGTLGAVADFTFDFSLPQLYVKGKNFQSMILNAPTYSTLELQSNGTATGYLGSGKSSNLTAATDVSLIGNSNVSIEGTTVYIYGSLHLPNSGQLGNLTTAYLNYATSSSLGSIMQWNWATSHNGQVGNVGLMVSSPNNANDFAILTATDNLEFITGGTTQSNVSGQIFKTTGNWVLQRGGTFTDDGVNKLQVGGGIKGLVGTSTKSFTTGGKIKEYFTDAGNTTTTETDLYTYTTEASILSANGASIQAEYGGAFVSSATATRELKVYFGGTVLFDSGALTISTTAQWTIYVSLIRVSSTVIRYMISLSADGVTLTAPVSSGEVTGLTLSNTNILKITGQAASTGAATNDIVAKLGAVYYWPVSI